jgi:hypothetical protein
MLSLARLPLTTALLTMFIDRDHRHQQKQAARCDPQYCDHKNEVHWTHYQNHTALQWQHTECEDHSIHWFIYDDRMQQNKAQEFEVYPSVIQAITDDLQSINPYVHHIRQFQPRSH